MSFKLSVISPEQVAWSGDAVSLTAPGADGELTVLSHHEPLITSLKPGVLRVRKDGAEEEIRIEGGVLEVSRNQATVLL